MPHLKSWVNSKVGVDFRSTVESQVCIHVISIDVSNVPHWTVCKKGCELVGKTRDTCGHDFLISHNHFSVSIQSRRCTTSFHQRTFFLVPERKSNFILHGSDGSRHKSSRSECVPSLNLRQMTFQVIPPFCLCRSNLKGSFYFTTGNV